MGSRITHLGTALADWSSRLLLAAGVLFVGHAAVRGIEAFTTLPTPVDVFGPAGYVVALLGLLGLVSMGIDRTGVLDRLAAAIAGLLLLAWAALAVWNLAEAAALLPSVSTVVTESLFVGLLLATLLTYLLFAAATRRGDEHHRTVTLLLVAPAGLLVVLLVGGVALSVAPAVGGVIIGVGLATIHLALGARLATGSASTARVSAAADSTVE